MTAVDDAIERAARTEHWRSLAIDSARQTHSDRAILAAEVKRLRERCGQPGHEAEGFCRCEKPVHPRSEAHACQHGAWL